MKGFISLLMEDFPQLAPNGLIPSRSLEKPLAKGLNPHPGATNDKGAATVFLPLVFSDPPGFFHKSCCVVILARFRHAQ